MLDSGWVTNPIQEVAYLGRFVASQIELLLTIIVEPEDCVQWT